MESYRLVFGLSADPIHVGHVEMVTQSAHALARRDYRLTEILLIPVYRRNPTDISKERIPETYAHRLAMCSLAAAEIAERLGPSFGLVLASEVEGELARGRSSPNYTAETLALLRARSDSRTGLIFLISGELMSGSDPQFGRWYRPDEILRNAALAVCPRPGYVANYDFITSLVERGAQVIMLDEVSTPQISASAIRDMLHAGTRPDDLARQGLLTPAVAAYLETHNVYGTAGG